MKRIISFLYILLAVTLSAAAQAQFSVDTEHVSFGQIEWKMPATAKYTVTNTGNQPLVLSNVEPDCACTAVEWTQTPIAPGGQGVVSITFDAEALGHFHKSVAIFTNAEPHLLYLTLGGEVVRKLKDYSKTHPYLIGTVRLSHDEIRFPDVHHGAHPVMQLGVVNLSDQPYEPVLMHLPSYLKAVASPAVLKENDRGTIILELDTEKLGDYGLTQSTVYLSRFPGDKVGEENEIPFSVVLLPDFSALSAAQRGQAGAINLDAQMTLDLSEQLAKKSKVRHTLTLTNTGRSPLRISKLQVSHPAVGVTLKKSLLQPGESTRMRITVQKKHLDDKKRPLRLLMITDDPAKPKVEIEIMI